jgi:hypothetical protein
LKPRETAHSFEIFLAQPDYNEAQDEAQTLQYFSTDWVLFDSTTKIKPDNIREGKMAGKEIQKDEHITVDGYVEKVELENGRIGVVLYDGEKDYYIAMDENGKELRRYVNEQVEVTGAMSEQNGEFWINVTNFHLIED